MRSRNDAGESLVEIVIAILVLGGVVTALVTTLATAANASKSHRELATADTVLRSYAEAAKAAARSQCDNGGTSYTVAYSAPSGFAVNTAAIGTRICPSPTAATGNVDTLHLTVTLPNGTTQKALDVYVRSP